MEGSLTHVDGPAYAGDAEDPRFAIAAVTGQGQAGQQPRVPSARRITIMTIGSRGDVQPLVALGKVEMTPNHTGGVSDCVCRCCGGGGDGCCCADALRDAWRRA
jgi:hypothetical protein